MSGTHATVVTSWPLPPGTRFELHRHRHHQLSIAARSSIAMAAADRTWVLPRSRALWVPAGVPHSVEAIGAAEMTAIWIDPARCPLSWEQPTVVTVDPLVSILVERLVDPNLGDGERARTEAVLYDALHPTEVGELDLVLPRDDRARAVADALLLHPGDDRTLVAWGHHVGASDRTLMRAFRSDTGVSFQAWRTRARMTAALGLLLTDLPIATIATTVGYATTSSFDAAFRRTVGVTPSTYRSPHAAGDDRPSD